MHDPFETLIFVLATDKSEQACQILENYSHSITSEQMTKALLKASARGNLSIAQILLDCGANPNGFLDQVPLINAVLCKNFQLVQLLISAKVDIDRQDENTYTALMYSIAIEDCQIFNLLVMAGANPKIETYDGDTAADIAERIGDLWKLEQMRKI
jgi:uncharacterized protein